MARADLNHWARAPRPGAEDELTGPAHVVQEGRRRQAVGRLAGMLFVVGSLALLPSTLLLRPQPSGWVYSLTVLGVASGLVCARVRWARLSPLWLDAVPALAAVQVTLVVWALPQGVLYSPLYVLVAVFAAFAMRLRRLIAGLLAVILAALVMMALLAGADDEQVVALVLIPIVGVSATMVVYLREQLEAGQEAYRRLAGLDPLTGVGNYRRLSERLEYELERHRRRSRPLTLILVDLDGFKAINDRLGHLAGDQALCQVAHALAGTLRAEDTLARQGGDEFSVLAPETGGPATLALIQRIKDAVAHASTDELALSATVGAAVFPTDGITADRLYRKADHELRRAKPVSDRLRAVRPGERGPALTRRRT